jgi:hypothetical protein
MVKNTGKPSEEIFDSHWPLRYGKRAWVFKFTDSAEATGQNKRITKVKAQPSDRVVVCNGRTMFAEVKSTWDAFRFDFSLLRRTQSAMARMIMVAGGEYYVYVHALALDRWFCVPYRTILQTKDVGRASLRWEELRGLEWDCAA